MAASNAPRTDSASPEGDPNEEARVAEAQVWIADACAKSYAYTRGEGRKPMKRELDRMRKGVHRLASIARRKPRARYPGLPTMKDVLYAYASDLEDRKCEPAAAKRLAATARSLP